MKQKDAYDLARLIVAGLETTCPPTRYRGSRPPKGTLISEERLEIGLTKLFLRMELPDEMRKQLERQIEKLDNPDLMEGVED